MQAYSETPDLAQRDCWGMCLAVPLTCLPLEMWAISFIAAICGIEVFSPYFMQPFKKQIIVSLFLNLLWLGFVTWFDLCLNFPKDWRGFYFRFSMQPNAEANYRKMRYDQGLLVI